MSSLNVISFVVFLSYCFIFLPLAFNNQTNQTGLLMLPMYSRALLGRTGFQGKVKAMQTKSHSSHEF
jgi:hypothetical protein